MSDTMRLTASEMIKASMGLIDVVMKGARDTAIALSGELTKQKGMAGDDDAGRAFAKVYQPAASTALDQIGFSSYIFGGTGKALMRTAQEFIVADRGIAATFSGQQPDMTEGMGDPNKDCTQNFTGLGKDLPEVVGDTAWYKQYSPGGGSRYRGDAKKVRAVAGTWRHAGKLMERFFSDAQVYATTAKNAHAGEAAKAFDRYFKHTVGFSDPPDRAQEHEPLVANLVAACHQISKACDKYADHIDAALRRILTNKAEPFRIEAPWDSPILGGNGDDGGLHIAVADDPYIHRLGDVAHALDSSRARVRIPGAPSVPGWHPLPLPGLPSLTPVPLIPASYTRGLPAGSRFNTSIPAQDPIPPDPLTGPKLLSPAEQSQFRTWMNSLNPGGFAGGGDQFLPENAYQLRVSGYPEREVPLPPEATGRSGKGLMVDGLRPADGYAVEAKYVHRPNCEKPTTFRNLDVLDKKLATPPKLDARGKLRFDPHIDAMYTGDEKELVRYKAAMANPSNQLRGMEIVTNDKDATAYWNSMMRMVGVDGSARYVP
ncbi:restriction endonuclease fold toxin-2 domain-containing protein [Streptomyces klenkii]|uniref:restriction endonuclease fold toxin-2 domain-containing protein n=1 Tax=Streptomyces klenkii TaxID=1420899 RepID=UPI0034397426